MRVIEDLKKETINVANNEIDESFPISINSNP
jgi:hypothetical protein